MVVFRVGSVPSWVVVQLPKPQGSFSLFWGAGDADPLSPWEGCCISLADRVAGRYLAQGLGSGSLWKGPDKLGCGTTLLWGCLNEGLHAGEDDSGGWGTLVPWRRAGNLGDGEH